MASSCCAYEEDTSSGSEPSTNKPPIQAPALQESDDSEEEEEEESDEAPPEPRTQHKGKSLSLEMSVFRLRIKRGLLNCTHCRRPLRPDTYNGRAYTCRRCVHGQIYCRQCIRLHHCRAADPQSTCKLLNHIIAQMKFKCDCNKYVPYCELLEHRRECPSVKHSKCNCKKYIPSCEFLEHGRDCRYAKCSTPAWWKCMLKASLLQCSECEVPIRPPIFLLWSNNLICSACYRAGISTSRHCTELEYLLRGIKVKCIACKQYFPFPGWGCPGWAIAHSSVNCKTSPQARVPENSSVMKRKLRDLWRATIVSMGKTSERFILRLVKWTSTFFTVMRLRVMMTHMMLHMMTTI